MLHEQIKKQHKRGDASKNIVLLETLRSMVAGFTNELVTKKKSQMKCLTMKGRLL